MFFFEEEPKKKRRIAIWTRIRLIGYIIIDYIIDLLNRNSRDYREVSTQLAEMKSRDKIQQQEQMRLETTGASVNNLHPKKISFIHHSFSRIQLSISIKELVVIISISKFSDKFIFAFFLSHLFQT